MSTQDRPLAEKPSPCWMWGRATFTMVVSSTTISWAVRMTKRSTDGLREMAPEPAGAARSGQSGPFEDAAG